MSGDEDTLILERWAGFAAIPRGLIITPPQALDRSQWHWSMWPALDLFGIETVWTVGLKTLGYPPTLVDMKIEADLIEAALLRM